MKNNKIVFSIVMMIFISIMISFSVLGDVAIISNTTSEETVSGFTATWILNESSTYNFYLASDSGFTTILYESNNNSTANSSTHIKVLTGLTGETTYYWKANGTSSVADSNSTYDTGTVIATTNNYVIRGIARTIIGIFTLIIMGILVLFIINNHFTTGTGHIRDLVIKIVVTIVGCLIVYNFVLVGLAT